MSVPTTKPRLFAAMLGSVGVVYGDIGTSPLYAFRESLAAANGHGMPQTEAVIGILSLIAWTLFMIVTFKYVVLLLRADNNGEGGILSLMALVQRAIEGENHRVLKVAVLALGMTGAALFYGDAVITPAISVLSALEGMELVTHRFEPYVIPIALIIMVALFSMQCRGTQQVSKFFGPLMLGWFLTMAAGGILHIQDTPAVWQALNPWNALYFLTHHGYASFIVLGAVFLAVTGAEALYADLGHFGKRPIRAAWLWLVMPALLLNYFGQAALVLTHPEAAENPFFLLYPDWALLPVVVMATLACVIASQAVITGAFSLTHQAIQLSLLPRLHVKYTSPNEAGQIYIPRVNWLLLAGVVLLIEFFRSSSALAAAYGIAVTGTMLITSILVYTIMRRQWHWPMLGALAVVVPLVTMDVAFLSANLTKLLEGGFVPVVFSAFVVLIMYIWVNGSKTLHEQLRNPNNTIASLLANLRRKPVARVDGTAVYLTSEPDFAPSALLQNLKHNHVLHAHNILLTLKFEKMPYVPEEKRLTVQPLSDDFTRVFLHFGYMEPSHITAALKHMRDVGMPLDMMNTTFFISRRNIVPSARFGMPLWQDHIFIAMSNNASDAADYFHIPRSRVVELGVQMTV